MVSSDKLFDFTNYPRRTSTPMQAREAAKNEFSCSVNLAKRLLLAAGITNLIGLL
jgi:hypothetical protein